MNRFLQQYESSESLISEFEENNVGRIIFPLIYSSVGNDLLHTVSDPVSTSLMKSEI